MHRRQFTFGLGIVVCIHGTLLAGEHVESTADAEHFEFSLSGPLASKLEPGTNLSFWNPQISVKGDVFLLKDLPVVLPFAKYGGQEWHVEFLSPTQRRSVFSVTLSPELFDKPRRIELKLDRPYPHIKPIFGFLGDVRYFAGITRRMRYRDLPSWDEERGQIVAAKPPVLEVYRAADGKRIAASAMKDGCMASKWWGAIDRSVGLGGRTDLVFAVRYDSGGLFEPIETRLDFTYHEALHGR